MGTFDIEQRLEHMDRELASAREAIAELRSLLNAAGVVGAVASSLPAGAKITDVLATHGYAINALSGRVSDLERANEEGIPLG